MKEADLRLGIIGAIGTFAVARAILDRLTERAEASHLEGTSHRETHRRQFPRLREVVHRGLESCSGQRPYPWSTPRTDLSVLVDTRDHLR